MFKVIDEPTSIMEFGKQHNNETKVKGSVVLVYNTQTKLYGALSRHNEHKIWLAGGGQELGESYYETATRELQEEMGISKFVESYQLGAGIVSHYYNEKKDSYRHSFAFAFLFVVDCAESGPQALESHEKFDLVWLPYSELIEELIKTGGGTEHWIECVQRAEKVVTE